MNHVVGKVAITLVALVAMVFGAAAQARADTVTFNLDNGSTLPDQLYGTITLTLNGSGGILVSIAMINGNKIIQTGQDVAVGFNSSLTPDPTIAASGFLSGYSLISGTPNGCSSPCHADGFGDFEYGISSIFNASGGGAGASSTLSFTVTKIGGFSSVFNLVENSTGGGIPSPFAVDIFCPQCAAGAQTGFVGATLGTTPVPEPASLVLLGTGALGAAAGIRRRKKA